MNLKRVRTLKEGTSGPGPVAYWMSRDQRAADNWALLYSQELALQRRVPLVVIFCLVPTFLGAARRQYGFLVEGLQQVARQLARKGIAFHLLTGSPQEAVSTFVTQHGIGLLVTDFDPLRIKQNWKAGVYDGIDIPVHEVDAHNVVPCWLASPKLEYAAYTFRPKLHRALPDFLEPFPSLVRHPYPWDAGEGTDWEAAARMLQVDETVPPVNWLKSGESAARRVLRSFLQTKLVHYDDVRNDPTQDGQSNLSPYLHFGQLSAQRVALKVHTYPLPDAAKAAFLEELLVRRELADNFCFYNQSYDSTAGFPDWAQKTLNAHRSDPREYLDSAEEFEQALTHDSLWNAAQMEMVRRGKMHGYMRMYWAKKILEWRQSPDDALKIAIYLNDKYELDGRDPNGYTGIAWSIGGVHDRAWQERPVFGKIRYMSHRGAQRKFDVQAYVGQHLP
jgi:deoxyribodipyrimidine photo-lyase